MENEHKTVFAIHKHGACRHQSRDASALALRNQRQAVHLAVAAEGLHQPLAFLLRGPDVQLGRCAADHLLARAPQHLAECGVHVDVAAVRDARDACGVGQRLVEGRVLGLGRAQRIFCRAVGGDVHVHADEAGRPVLGVARGHRAARHEPVPTALGVHHPEFGFVAVFQPVHGPRQPGRIALGILRVAPGIPALPQVWRLQVGGGDAEGFIEAAVASELALHHIPLPVPATHGVEHQAQPALLLCEGLLDVAA
ncbi:hypothetical protein D3C71_1215080 [compost metagenome]